MTTGKHSNPEDDNIQDEIDIKRDDFLRKMTTKLKHLLNDIHNEAEIFYNTSLINDQYTSSCDKLKEELFYNLNDTLYNGFDVDLSDSSSSSSQSSSVISYESHEISSPISQYDSDSDDQSSNDDDDSDNSSDSNNNDMETD